jgi:hypothetical protein
MKLLARKDNMKSVSEHGELLIKLSEFVKQLDEEVRLEAFKFLLARETGGVAWPEPAVNGKIQQEHPGVAPQELLRRTARLSFTEKAVVLAYWLEKYQQRPTFSSADLKAAFEQAREQSAKNPSDLAAKLEATARIMKAEKSQGIQHYRLTGTAIEEVETWLGSQEEKANQNTSE